ncbi:MAG: hypothetical protein HY920_01260, partial [Elusimicrobia bacterium]|nr:hypothetical protein [Elusimicrobiota bacterium]
MKFLLINAIENKSTIQEKYFPPLGLGYIAAYLKEYLPGIEIKIVEENIREVLEKFLPD